MTKPSIQIISQNPTSQRNKKPEKLLEEQIPYPIHTTSLEIINHNL